VRWGRTGALRYEHPDEAGGPVTATRHPQEPHIRATLADGSVVDGKAAAWAKGTVLVAWGGRGRPVPPVG
jgi:hypothetical protein